jgi:uncharacterized membrane protein
MQTRTEPSGKRRAKRGLWPYPSRAEDDAARQEASASAPPGPTPRRAFAAGAALGPEGGQPGAQLSRALGWLSIGVGLAALLAPRAIARNAGLPSSTLLLRAVGVRELVCGVGLLTQPKAPAWRWSRVAGDAMDLALLGYAARAAGPGRLDGARGRLGATAMLVAGVTALDVVAGTQAMPGRQRSLDAPGSAQLKGEAGIPVEESITINRSPDNCYHYWRELEQLPRFMRHLESVRRLDERRSHWKAKGPAGASVEWDAEITEDEPGRRLAWRSVGAADVDNSGAVEFAPGPGGRGTTVRVSLRYAPPAGKLGAAAAKLFGAEPAQQIKDDLRRFKQLLEAGEIATTEGQPSGARSLAARLLGIGKGARA